MIYELENNSRTIGADLPEIAEKVKTIYQTFCKGEIICTDIRTAEMSKVVENTFRAVNIAFANELTKIARYDNLDVHEIIRISNMHPRVNILNPGPGVGDTAYLLIRGFSWRLSKINEIDFSGIRS